MKAIAPRLFQMLSSRYRVRKESIPSDHFYRHGGGFTTTNAKRSDPALPAPVLEGMDQRHQDARAGGADRVAEGAGAAVHVDARVFDLELGHGGHGHHRESL